MQPSNIKLNDPMWTQASLPTSMAGLGIRRAADLTLLAFLASTHATRELVLSVLPEGEPAEDPLQEEAICMWRESSSGETPPDHSRGSQRLWDQGLMEKAHKNLLHSTTDSITTARLHATATKESGACTSSALGNEVRQQHTTYCRRLGFRSRGGTQVRMWFSCEQEGHTRPQLQTERREVCTPS